MGLLDQCRSWVVAVNQDSQRMSFRFNMASRQHLIPLICPVSPHEISPFWRKVWRDKRISLADRLLSRHFGAKYGAILRVPLVGEGLSRHRGGMYGVFIG
jgi:hypothetical protein